MSPPMTRIVVSKTDKVTPGIPIVTPVRKLSSDTQPRACSNSSSSPMMKRVSSASTMVAPSPPRRLSPRRARGSSSSSPHAASR